MFIRLINRQSDTSHRNPRREVHRSQYFDESSESFDEDDDDDEQQISVSSRGRVRKISSKVRGYFRE